MQDEFINCRAVKDTTKNHIFIQARVGSTRLPNKVLKRICSMSIIELIVERLKKVENIDKIIIVTGPEQKNKSLIKHIKQLNLDYFCGSEQNVLDRFYKASQRFKSDNVIRVTADCPLIDFNLINKGLDIFIKKNCDILSNNKIRTYPHGLNFEIFKKEILKKAWIEKNKESENEKEFTKIFMPPTQYMLENEKFKHCDLIYEKGDFSMIRLTLDYQEDYKLIKKIYEHLYTKNKYFSLDDILLFLKNNPSLLQINQKYVN